MDQSGNYISFSPDGLDPKKLLSLKRKAVWGFYLRPRFLFRQLFGKKSLYELANMVYQGCFLILGDIFVHTKSK